MTPNMQALIDELTGDPLGRGYAGMTDEQVVASLNTVDRDRFRSNIPNREVFGAIDLTEYKALTAAERQALDLVMAMDAVDATDANTRVLLGTIFPQGSTTRANLIALAEETVSRAAELGLGRVLPGRVAMARG